MSIINYFFTGFIFTFIIDLILGLKMIQENPKIKNILDVNWTLGARIMCIIICPVGMLIFLVSFIKQFYKK